MPFFKWSRDAATNSTSDPTCPWPEGMAPSQVNDSARGNMAALRQWGDDIAGAIVTGGTSTAYTLSSYQGFDSFAHMDGQMIAFTPHVTNAAGSVTLNVDGLGARGIAIQTGVNAGTNAGILIAGTPYTATFSNGTGQWLLHGFYGNPYSIPLLGGLDYWGATAPNSSFVFPVGQAVSRTVYAAAFALVGTTFGAGDGSTTFNLPDKRGRVSQGSDNMGGVPAGRTGLGYSQTGGSATTTIAQANLPAVSVSITGTTSGYDPNRSAVTIGASSTQDGFGLDFGVFATDRYSAIPGFSSLSVSGNTANLGSGSPLGVLQPTIGCNYIIRII